MPICNNKIVPSRAKWGEAKIFAKNSAFYHNFQPFTYSFACEIWEVIPKFEVFGGWDCLKKSVDPWKISVAKVHGVRRAAASQMECIFDIKNRRKY